MGISASATAQVGHDRHLFHQLVGQLGFHIEKTDRIHFVAEKVDTYRLFLGKRIYIDYTSANGKLSRLVHEIATFETVFHQ